MKIPSHNFDRAAPDRVFDRAFRVAPTMHLRAEDSREAKNDHPSCWKASRFCKIRVVFIESQRNVG